MTISFWTGSRRVSSTSRTATGTSPHVRPGRRTTS